MTDEKIYIIDTNVLVYDPEAIQFFNNVTIGLPLVVLEELDHFKSDSSSRGVHAREVIRYLDLMRERGSLKDGVKLDNGSILRILFIPKLATLANELPLESVDNQILLIARSMKDQNFDVRLVSKDLNMRIKADVLGIPSIDYIKNLVPKKKLYKGWVCILISSHDMQKIKIEKIYNLLIDYNFDVDMLVINEFILFESRHNRYNYRIFRYLGQKKFKEVVTPLLSFPLEPRNPQQLMALDLLFDPSISLITLIGPAGTGKTFLTLLAAIEKVIFQDEYEKILISRPVVPLGPDIGYLPGDIQEKLMSWMQPIYDNMEFILHSNQMRQIQKESALYKGPENRKQRRSFAKERKALTIDSLIGSGKISLEAITYMRGRSIPYQFIFIDEVQNLTPHEVKTLISRVGQGSKIILAGDPYQIDAHYLDFINNGLVVASNKFKNQSLFGTVYLETTERSELSKLASELL